MRNIKIARKKIIKEAAYKTIVKPVLKYASPVWDPCTSDKTNTLEKVQKHAGRWYYIDIAKPPVVTRC